MTQKNKAYRVVTVDGVSRKNQKKYASAVVIPETWETVTVQQVGSPIRCPAIQRLHLQSLGLRKMNQIRQLKNTPEVRGLIKRIPHLVRIVEEVQS
jgi:large subunit ribosomal protein L30